MIEKALEVASVRKLELANMMALPQASGWNAQMRTKGVKQSDTSWFNPFPDKLLEFEARKIIDPKTARLFLRLLKAKKVPAWAARHADLDLIKAAAR